NRIRSGKKSSGVRCQVRDHEIAEAAHVGASPGGMRINIPKTHIAPVLGGGRFTQPGTDGGECSTRHYGDTHYRMVRRISPGAAAAPVQTSTPFIPAQAGIQFLTHYALAPRFPPSRGALRRTQTRRSSRSERRPGRGDERWFSGLRRLVVILVGGLAGSNRLGDWASVLAHLRLDLGGHVGIVLEELLGVLAALPDARAVIGEPGAG